MNVVWLIDDPDPLPKAAVELGVRILAEKVGATSPSDGTVLLRRRSVLGGYPFATAHAHDGSAVYLIEYEAVLDALAHVADAELREAGLDPDEPSFAVQFRRFIERRFPHWPPEYRTELAQAASRIEQILLAILEDDDGDEKPTG
jgi:hypothetical protein